MTSEREIIYEIFTIYGWVKVKEEGYRMHSGIKRWRYADEDEDK